MADIFLHANTHTFITNIRPANTLKQSLTPNTNPVMWRHSGYPQLLPSVVVDVEFLFHLELQITFITCRHVSFCIRRPKKTLRAQSIPQLLLCHTPRLGGVDFFLPFNIRCIEGCKDFFDWFGSARGHLYLANCPFPRHTGHAPPPSNAPAPPHLPQS